MESALGVRVCLRDVETIEDLGVVTAPWPVEPGDIVASSENVFRVVVVLAPVHGRPVEPVLARSIVLARW